MEKKSLPNSYKYFGIFLVLTILILLFDIIGVFSPIYKYSSYLFKPAYSIITNSTIFLEDSVELIPKIALLKSENENLKQQIIELNSTNSELQKKADEASYEFDQNKFVEKNEEYKLLPAEVIALEKTPLEIFLIINVGSKDSIQKGQTVIFQNFLVGRIDEIYEKTARVAVIGSTNNSVPVITQTTKINAVLISNLEDGVHISNILPGETPKKGENVISSSLGDQYQYGFLVGKVGKILSTESESVQRYEIERVIEYKDLKNISVIVE